MLTNKIIQFASTSRILQNSFFTTGKILQEEVAEEEIRDTDTKITDPAKDRRNPISVETSIRYLESNAYQETYQGNLVWSLYRRNFKGQFAPYYTRRTCIRAGFISTGNPCPICRDQYLVLDYRNVKLLEQFISPFNEEILSFTKTGVCQLQHRKLLAAVLKARNHGLLTFSVPFREYDYSTYTKQLNAHP